MPNANELGAEKTLVSRPMSSAPFSHACSRSDSNSLIFAATGGMLKFVEPIECSRLEPSRPPGVAAPCSTQGGAEHSAQRIAAAMLPPSTVVTPPVVFIARAWCTKACATSSAPTSSRSRLPRM